MVRVAVRVMGVNLWVLRSGVLLLLLLLRVVLRKMVHV